MGTSERHAVVISAGKNDESLREGRILLEDLRDEVNRWLTWLDRRFDRRIVNDRLRELEG